MSSNSIVAFQSDTSDQFTFEFYGHQVQGVVIDGAPWFYATEVAQAIGHRDAASLTRRLRASQKGTRSRCTPGGRQQATVISVSGLTRAVLRSRAPQADEFIDYVSEVVLPAWTSARRQVDDGGLSDVLLRNPRAGARYLTELADAQDTAHAATARAAAAEQELSELRQQVQEIIDAQSGKDNNLLVRQVATNIKSLGVLGVGQDNLFSWLVSHKWLYRTRDGRYEPTSRSVDMGRVAIRHGRRRNDPGVETRTAVITPKGATDLMVNFKTGEYTLVDVPAGGGAGV